MAGSTCGAGRSDTRSDTLARVSSTRRLGSARPSGTWMATNLQAGSCLRFANTYRPIAPTRSGRPAGEIDVPGA